MGSDVYNRGKLRIGLQDGLTGDGDIVAMLLKSPFAYDPDDNIVSDISADEISGAGYSTASLTGRTNTEDDTLDKLTMAANSVSFGSIVAGETITDCVLFLSSGNHLICRVTVDNTDTNGQDVSLEFNGATPGAFLDGLSATTHDVYNRGKMNYVDKGQLQPMTAMLLKSPYAFEQDDNVVADISVDEISGAGYARDTLTLGIVEEDSPDNRAVINATSAAFGSIVAGEQVTDCVIFETGTNELVCRVPLTPINTNGQPFGVDFEGLSPGDFMRLHETDPG